MGKFSPHPAIESRAVFALYARLVFRALGEQTMLRQDVTANEPVACVGVKSLQARGSGTVIDHTCACLGKSLNQVFSVFSVASFRRFEEHGGPVVSKDGIILNRIQLLFVGRRMRFLRDAVFRSRRQPCLLFNVA